ncbi:hypothetical protein ACA910_000508 [Epithemia clementina (nom. ined.)]
MAERFRGNRRRPPGRATDSRPGRAVPAAAAGGGANTTTPTTPSSSSLSSKFGSTLVSIGTTALAAYGAYQLASLAYETFHEQEGDGVDDAEQRQGRTMTTTTTTTSSLWQFLWNGSSTSDQATTVLEEIGRVSQGTTAFVRNKNNTSNGYHHHPSLFNYVNDARSATRRRRRQIRSCRNQVRDVLHRLIPTVLKQSIFESTDYQPERQALQALRRCRRTGISTATTPTTNRTTASSTPSTEMAANNDHGGSHDPDKQNGNNDNEDAEPQQSEQQLISPQQLTEEQQEQDIKELALWKTIVTQSITRLVLTIYAPSLLFVVLTMQVSVMLSSKAKDGEDDDDDDEESDEDAQKWVLDQTFQFMFQHGLPSLMDSVQRMVQTVLAENPQEWQIMSSSDDSNNKNKNENNQNANAGNGQKPSTTTTETSGHENGDAEDHNNNALLQQVTPRQFDIVLQKVHSRLRQDNIVHRERSLLRFVQPPSVVVGFDDDDDEGHDFVAASPPSEDYGTSRDSSLKEQHHHQQQRRCCRRRRMDMLDRTWDVLESPMVEDALQDALRVMQQLLIQNIFQQQGAATSSSTTTTSRETSGPEQGQQHQNNDSSSTIVQQPGSSSSLPLTQVLPAIKKSCQAFFAAFAKQTHADGGINTDNHVSNHNHHSTNLYLRSLEHLPPINEAMDYFFSHQ